MDEKYLQNCKYQHTNEKGAIKHQFARGKREDSKRNADASMSAEDKIREVKM